MPKTVVFSCCLILFFLAFKGNAQSVEGKWYGIGRVQMEDASDNYMAEMILKQDGKLVKGEFNYYFKDRQKSNKIEGSFDKNTRILIIKGLPVIFYRTNDTRKSVESVMTGRFELRVSKTASVLNGMLTSNADHQYMVPDIKYRFLRSISEPIDTVVTEEEPELLTLDRNIVQKQIDSTASIAKQKNKAKTDSTNLLQAKNDALNVSALAKTKAPKPVPQKETQVKNSAIAASNSKLGNPISNPIPVTELVASSTNSNKNLTENLLPIKDTIPMVETRQKNYIREIELDNDRIRVEIYDNGTIDYDSVSLHLNGKEVMAKSMLNHRAIKVNLQLDPTKEFNELSMFAENLGMIPPNTAALIVRDGQKEYQLLLQSDFSKSATLKLKVKKPVH